jgi:drug/metabolite transporter (DMT)-like permease
LTCLTIAFQSDKSTTVSLLAYIELVYAFMADILLFDSTFTRMELVGAAIITFFNVLTIVERGKVEEERRS